MPINDAEEAIIVATLNNVVTLGDTVVSKINDITKQIQFNFKLKFEVESLHEIVNSLNEVKLKVLTLQQTIAKLAIDSEGRKRDKMYKINWWKLEQIKQQIVENILETNAQLLFSLQIIIGKLINYFNDEYIGNELKKFANFINVSLNNIRHTSNSLYPLLLKDLGVVPAVKSYVENLVKSEKLKNRYYIIGKLKRYPNIVELKVYRAYQQIDSVLFQYKYATIEKITFYDLNESIQFNVFGYGETNKLIKFIDWIKLKENLKMLDGTLTIVNNEKTFDINVKFCKGVEKL